MPYHYLNKVKKSLILEIIFFTYFRNAKHVLSCKSLCSSIVDQFKNSILAVCSINYYLLDHSSPSSSVGYRISSDIRRRFFSFQNNPKGLDPSCKMDLDLWDCLGSVKLVL